MIINKQALSAALKMVSPVISANPIIPALVGVKITDKFLTGGNSWVSIAVPIQLGIGEALLDFQTLNKAVPAFTEEADLTIVGEVAILQNKEHKKKVQIPVIGEVKDYPGITQEFKHNTFTLTREDILGIAGLAEFTDLPDSVRPLKGIMYDGNYFYASDGHTMATYQKESNFKGESVFPKDLFKLLSNVPATEYLFQDGVVHASANGNKIAFVKYLLYDENFPAIRDVLDRMNFSKKTTVQHNDLADALSLLSISTNEATKTIEFHYSQENGLTGKAYNTDLNKLSETEIESGIEGFEGNFAIGMNHQLLAKGLKYLGGEGYAIELSSPQHPVRITSENEERLFIIMPYSIQ